MTELTRYRNVVYDSVRWTDFAFRDDDIVISTPPKCGTTWMQNLCAMLVLDAVEFDRPLAEISPWLDMQTTTLPAMLGLLESQEHRRIIKTHTPLDGVPADDRVTYIGVGRDPRDVALSFEHHLANLDFDVFMAVRAAAVGLDDMAEFGPPPEPPSDPVERFWGWTYGPADLPMRTLAGILHHLQTFWDRRGDPNIALFHYSDLLADLPGQLRHLAAELAIEVDDDRIEEFATAATFERMKQRAGDLAPNSGDGFWRDTSEFFHRGRNGQWQGLLDDDGLRRYRERVAELVAPDLAAWAHDGTLGRAW